MNQDIQLRNKYNKIFENGVAHIESAIALANIKRYDFAIAHIVLGIEELIKYQVTWSYFAGGSTFQADEMKKVFRFHGTKHALIEEFQKSISEEFSELFQDYVFRISSGQQIEDRHEPAKKNRFKELGSFLNIALSQINLSPAERDDFFNWLKSADEYKKNGFYVDYNDEKKVWKFPDSLSEADYLRALKYATVIRSQTTFIKGLDITSDEMLAFLNTQVTLDEFRNL